MDSTTITDETTEAPKRKRAKAEGETETTEASAAASTEASAETSEPSAESVEAPSESAPAAETAPSADDAKAEPEPETAAEPISERRRLQEQLEALERKQAELRRALAIADHPELADAIRVVEGRAYAITRAEAKMAQGLSKAEERRRDTLEKKLAAARAKRDELDQQIAELERELAPLGEERMRAFREERRAALEALVSALGQHDAAFAAAGLEVGALVPEVTKWTAELREIAEEIVARGKA